jgi:fluoride exporter
MNRNILIVGLGGFIGSIARYLIALSLAKSFQPFPTGTFLINIVGCLAIGIVYGISDRSAILSPQWRLFLATGVCGGFTTFSSFAYENVNLLEIQQYSVATLYTVGSIVLGFLTAAIGVFLTRQF